MAVASLPATRDGERAPGDELGRRTRTRPLWSASNSKGGVFNEGKNCSALERFKSKEQFKEGMPVVPVVDGAAAREETGEGTERERAPKGE